MNANICMCLLAQLINSAITLGNLEQQCVLYCRVVWLDLIHPNAVIQVNLITSLISHYVSIHMYIKGNYS